MGPLLTEQALQPHLFWFGVALKQYKTRHLPLSRFPSQYASFFGWLVFWASFLVTFFGFVSCSIASFSGVSVRMADFRFLLFCVDQLWNEGWWSQVSCEGGGRTSLRQRSWGGGGRISLCQRRCGGGTRLTYWHWTSWAVRNQRRSKVWVTDFLSIKRSNSSGAETSWNIHLCSWHWEGYPNNARYVIDWHWQAWVGLLEMMEELDKIFRHHPALRVGHTNASRWAIVDEIILEMHSLEYERRWPHLSVSTHSDNMVRLLDCWDPSFVHVPNVIPFKFVFINNLFKVVSVKVNVSWQAGCLWAPYW